LGSLVFGEDVRTHAGLHERAARLATVLEEDGVGRGDRVALLLHNGFEFVESLLAIQMLTAVAVPVNFRLTADELSYIVRDSGAVW
jgi:acyl-CoA synthetase (AMP-forming)/AMP-acid ligase II